MRLHCVFRLARVVRPRSALLAALTAVVPQNAPLHKDGGWGRALAHEAADGPKAGLRLYHDFSPVSIALRLQCHPTLAAVTSSMHVSPSAGHVCGILQCHASLEVKEAQHGSTVLHDLCEQWILAQRAKDGCSGWDSPARCCGELTAKCERWTAQFTQAHAQNHHSSIRKRSAAHLPEGVDDGRVASGNVLCSGLREALRRPDLLHRGALPLGVARARELRARRQLCQVGRRHAPALQRLAVNCRVEALQNIAEK